MAARGRKKALGGKSVQVSVGKDKVTVQIFRPQSFSNAVILGNGAGANLQSTFMQTFARSLVDRGIYTALFNFVYQEKQRKVPDKPALLEETYRAVLAKVEQDSGLSEAQIALGGKSMGGRIATQIAGSTQCKKIVLLGYPLHPPGQPEKIRDAHLYALKAQLLFVSGSRDPFCNPGLFASVIEKLPRARVMIIENGGHSLEIPKKSGSQEEVYRQTSDAIAAFLSGHKVRAPGQ